MSREQFNLCCVFAGLADPDWKVWMDFVHYHRSFAVWVVRFRHLLFERGLSHV